MPDFSRHSDKILRSFRVGESVRFADVNSFVTDTNLQGDTSYADFQAHIAAASVHGDLQLKRTKVNKAIDVGVNDGDFVDADVAAMTDIDNVVAKTAATGTTDKAALL